MFVMRISLISAATFFSVRWMIEQLDPTKKQKKLAKKRVITLLPLCAKWPKFVIVLQLSCTSNVYHVPLIIYFSGSGAVKKTWD